MTGELKSIQESLEDILDDYKYNIKEYQAAQEKRGHLGFLLKITGKTRATQALRALEEHRRNHDALVKALEGISKSLEKNCGGAPGIRSNTLLAIAEIGAITEAAFKAMRG